jgi:hypothetical protein
MPDADERRALSALHDKSLTAFRNNPDAARSVIRTGEYEVPSDLAPASLAAMTMVTRVVLNLHELITRN